MSMWLWIVPLVFLVAIAGVVLLSRWSDPTPDCEMPSDGYFKPEDVL